MFWSSVGSIVAGGVVCHNFVSRLFVLWEPWDLQLLVESVVFPTKSPPGDQWGAAILVTGGGAAQNRDFQALKMPCLYEESVLCA